MSKAEEIDDIAQGIADITIELMTDSVDWQIADQLVNGVEYDELHNYVMNAAIEKMYKEMIKQSGGIPKNLRKVLNIKRMK